MDDNKLLNQIGDLMDKKLQPLTTDLKEVRKRLGGTEKRLDGVEKRLGGVQKQLDTVELKVEVVNKRVDQLGGQLKQTEQSLANAIVKSQEETIEVLSDLIHTGYNMHEKRIKKIEDTLQITNPQQ